MVVGLNLIAVIQLSSYENNNCSAFSAVKKIILYYNSSWSLHTTKILFKKKNQKVSVKAIKQDLENYVNIFYVLDLFYFMHTIYCIPDILSVCMGVYDRAQLIINF